MGKISPGKFALFVMLIAFTAGAEEVSPSRALMDFELTREVYLRKAPHCETSWIGKIVEFQSAGPGAAKGPATTRTFDDATTARKALGLIAPPPKGDLAASEVLGKFRRLRRRLSDKQQLKFLQSFECHLTPSSDLLERLARFQATHPTAFSPHEKKAYLESVRSFMLEDEVVWDLLPLVIRLNVLSTVANSGLVSLSESDLIKLNDFRFRVTEHFQALRARKAHLQEGEADDDPESVALSKKLRMIEASRSFRTEFRTYVEKALGKI